MIAGTILALLALWLAWDVLLVPLLGVRQMTPWRLRRRLASGDAPVILDVRTRAEYAWFHIPGSVNAPYPPPPPEELGISPDDEVLVVCMTGHRSPLAARRLKRQGVARVANLTWGALAFRILGGETRNGDTP